jgi:hypothetical protein
VACPSAVVQPKRGHALTPHGWCMQDDKVCPYLEMFMSFCKVITREEPEDSASRACFLRVLVLSVDLASALAVATDPSHSISVALTWLDGAVMQLAGAVATWEGAWQHAKDHLLQRGLLVAWVRYFDAVDMGGLCSVLQLASCMLAPLSRAGAEAAAAAGGRARRGPMFSRRAGGDGAQLPADALARQVQYTHSFLSKLFSCMYWRPSTHVVYASTLGWALFQGRMCSVARLWPHLSCPAPHSDDWMLGTCTADGARTAAARRCRPQVMGS